VQNAVIIVTLVLGAIVVLVALVALLKKKPAGGEASLKLGGIELSGKGGPVVFLLVGAALVWASFNWATSQDEVESAREDEQKCVEETDKIHTRLQDQVRLTSALRDMAPEEKLKTLSPDLRRVLEARPYVAPDTLRQRMERVRIIR